MSSQLPEMAYDPKTDEYVLPNGSRLSRFEFDQIKRDMELVQREWLKASEGREAKIAEDNARITRVSGRTQ